MTNYEIIKAACQKANPDLMKLSFGCKMKNLHQEESNPYQIKTFFRKIYGGHVQYQCLEHDGRLSKFPMDALEILGHEPQLNDVLILLQQKHRDYIYMIDADGSIWKSDTNSYGMAEEAHYDLAKPLKEQSEETLSFIASLL